MRRTLASLILCTLIGGLAISQDKSVRPGINDSFRNPDVKKYEGTFEGESREVSVKRKEIVKAIGLKPGNVVADVGAGTGMFTRLFATEVGEKGKVFAVDISEKFLEHIRTTSKAAGIGNVTTTLCKPDSAELPAASVDVVYICDTYHHFEFPQRTMASIHKALKPGGRVVVIDFRRVKGESSDWVMSHVRAGQDVVEKEIEEVGFKKTHESKDLLKENYLVVFEKIENKQSKVSFPIIPGYGGVYPVEGGVELPVRGSKVVVDATSATKEAGRPLPCLERAALLLNLAGASGLKSADLEIVIVLHGDATPASLAAEAYREKYGRANDSLELMKSLSKAGVRILVCGQSLHRKGLDPKAIAPGITISSSAVSAVINLQARGHAYIPSH